MASSPGSTALQGPFFVACLCAAWCHLCGSYGAAFHEVQALWPDARFIWVDIEDEADLVDGLDVENFPTVLIARGATPLFFGPLTPQPATLDRLVRACRDDAPVEVADPAVKELALRLAGRLAPAA